LHYHHQNTRKCAGVLYAEVFSRLYPVDQATLPNPKTLREEVTRVISFIETHYFKDSVYMIGTKLTPADLAAYFELQSLIVVNFDFAPYEKISKWMKVLDDNEHIRQTNHNFMRLLPKIKLPTSKL
jgi:glutathione S-transferase